MTTEEKFCAAVNVINSLPRDGPFQPSPDLLLKFYSYHKQATEGPCNAEKPYFWDSIGRTKWNAWKSLGDMPKVVAMEKYAGELIKIVETMSYSESVSDFMDLVGPFYESVFIDEPEVQTDENKRACASENMNDNAKQDDHKQKQRHLSSSTEKAILQVDPQEKEKRLYFSKDFPLQPSNQASLENPFLAVNSNILLNDIRLVKINSRENGSCRKGTVNAVSITGGDAICRKTRSSATKSVPHVTLKEILLLSVISLHQSLEKIIKHLDALEILIKNSQQEEQQHIAPPRNPPKSGLRSWSLALFLFWPLVVQWLITIRRRKK